MTRRKSICILSFSPIARDGRVLRQIEYLSPHYDLTIIGYGPPHPNWADHANVRWVEIAYPEPLSESWRKDNLSNLPSLVTQEFGQIINKLTFRLGRRWPFLYDFGFQMRWRATPKLMQALFTKHDAYHANDWNTVPLAARAARRHGARLVLDLHEYAPLEFEFRANWPQHEAMIRHLLHKYSKDADASITVAPVIAERYHQEFDLDPIVVMNAPHFTDLPPKTFDAQNIRLIHHGSSSPVRKPERMIETIARCDSRYSLHFMLLPSPYVQELKQIAQAVAPGRVTFHEPVAQEKIITRIAEFDIGLVLLPALSFNDEAALPNKFFDSINAGLAVCIGPSSSMAQIIETYDCGLVSPTFQPEDMADLLNQTTGQEWMKMQSAARKAAKMLNADHEMQKVIDLYSQLLADEHQLLAEK